MAVLTLVDFLISAPVWDQRRPLSERLVELLQQLRQPEVDPSSQLKFNPSISAASFESRPSEPRLSEPRSSESKQSDSVCFVDAGIVVVDAQHRPLGWLSGLALLRGMNPPHLSERCDQTWCDLAWCDLATLAVTLTPEQFWLQLQQSSLAETAVNPAAPIWAIVNTAGEYLGLLNVAGLIRYLASQSPLLACPLPVKTLASYSTFAEGGLTQTRPVIGPSSTFSPRLLSPGPTPKLQPFMGNWPGPWTILQQLQQEVAELQTRNQQHRDFLGAISHELKNPLTAILGLTTVLKGQGLGSLNPRQANYVDLLHQGGRKALTLVNYLLELAQIELGPQQLQTEQLDLVALSEQSFDLAHQGISTSQSADLLSPQPHLSDRPFPWAGPPEPQAIRTMMGNGRRLRQTLVHLFTYLLRCLPTDQQLQVEVKVWPGWVCWLILVPGMSIPLAQQPQLLEPFGQFEDGSNSQVGNIGLSLLLARRLAQLQGGDLAFIAWPERPCQFSLLLPQPLLDSLERDSEEDVGPNQRQRLVLIAEPTLAGQQQLFEHLQNLHYYPVLARTAAEVQLKAQCLQPAVIFLNLSLGGTALLNRLNTDSQTQHLPVVLLATEVGSNGLTNGATEQSVALPVGVVAQLTLSPSATGLEQVLGHLQAQAQTWPTRLGKTSIHPLSRSDGEGNPSNRPSLTVLRIGHTLGFPLPQCRILEADDLEQGELLARIWQPDILLWDWLHPDPASELRVLCRYPRLANLPIVTLDLATTRAATQFAQLQVFPCLVAETLTTTPAEQVAATLWQVVQVAAHATRLPSRLE